MQEILPNQNQKNNHVISSQIELLNAGEAGSKAEPCKLLLKQDLEAAGRVLAEGQLPEDFSPLKGGRAERGAGGGSRPRFGESEGQGPAVLLVLEQVAGVKRQKRAKNETRRRVKNKQKSKSIVACEARKWSVLWMKKKSPEEVFFNRFRCKSWRCELCSKKVRNKHYLQMEEGFKRNPGQYLYMVLTYDQKKWKNEDSAYKALSNQTSKLIKRIEREFGRITGAVTVEQHEKGFPHVNIVFKFMNEMIVDEEWVKKSFERRFIKPHAIACGFGRMSTVSLVNNGEELKTLSYITKSGLTMIGSELNKKSQLPLNAPKGFRRVRSLRGFMKPLKKESEYTGEVVKAELESVDDFITENGSEVVIEKLAEKYPQVVTAKKATVIKPDVGKVTSLFRVEIDYETGEIKDLTPESKISAYCLEQRESG